VKQTQSAHTIEQLLPQTYCFTIALKYMDACCIVLSLNPNTPNTCTTRWSVTIGSIVYTHGAGVEQWKRVLANMRHAHHVWHRLLPANNDVSNHVDHKPNT